MEPSKWQHVISEPNPADYASQGIKASETKKLEKWNNGADLVCRGEEEWLPQPLEASEELLDIDKGVKREKITVGAAVQQKDFSNLLFKMLFYLRSAAKNSCVAYPSLQQTYV